MDYCSLNCQEIPVPWSAHFSVKEGLDTTNHHLLMSRLALQLLVDVPSESAP